jgi:serine/threonine-protein kinase
LSTPFDEELKKTSPELVESEDFASTGDSTDINATRILDADARPRSESNGNAVNPLIGQIFDGKYQLTRVVGKGGMSVVYEAKHLLMNKIVALKLMHTHLLQSEKAVRRFQKEAQAVSTLDHSGVMRIYDFGVSPDGAPYIAMEFLEGKPLSDCIHEDGKLEEERALTVFKTVAETLAHAHSKRVIHRDLKPSNIVLSQTNDPTQPIKATVVDFGIAKLTDEDGEDPLQMTATGEVFGSPLYMSPEQCAGRELDQRSDIYSFGCLMYEAVTGRTPFEAKTAVALFHRHMKDEAPRFSTLNEKPAVSAELEEIILRCLEKHPQDRYQSMDELVDAFENLSGMGGAMSSLHRFRSRQSTRLLVFALLMVVLGVPILVTQWHLVLGQAFFLMLVLAICSFGSYSTFAKYFRMRDAMKTRSPSLNFVQKFRLSFTLFMAFILSVWSVGMVTYIASMGFGRPAFLETLANWLWAGSLILVCGYFVGIIIFAAITAISAISKEST